MNSFYYAVMIIVVFAPTLVYGCLFLLNKWGLLSPRAKK
jgi:hypothetical protein